MRLSKFLAVGAATASLILIVAAPSHAQQRKTLQNQRQHTTVKPVAVNPAAVKSNVRSVAPTVRDHRKAANPAVKPSGEKRGPCVTSVVGGSCVGGTVGKVGKAFATSGVPGFAIKHKKPRERVVDHRKK
jgi:hypothetical protein